MCSARFKVIAQRLIKLDTPHLSVATCAHTAALVSHSAAQTDKVILQCENGYQFCKTFAYDTHNSHRSVLCIYPVTAFIRHICRQMHRHPQAHVQMHSVLFD